MAWPEIKQRYFEATAELRDRFRGALTTLDDTEAVASLATDYLDSMLFCIDVAVETGKLEKRRHSQQARDIEYSERFTKCKNLIRDLLEFISQQKEEIKKLADFRETGDALTIFVHIPEDVEVTSIHVTRVENVRDQLEAVRKSTVNRQLKFDQDFEEQCEPLEGTPFPVRRSEYRDMYPRFLAAVGELGDFQERRTLARNTFTRLKLYDI